MKKKNKYKKAEVRGRNDVNTESNIENNFEENIDRSAEESAIVNNEPNVADLLERVISRLTFLEKKIDTLVNRGSEKQSEGRSFRRPQQSFGRPQRFGGTGRDNNFRDRQLFKTVCAECNEECEVPFRPSGDRPVYCKECFSKRRSDDGFNERPDNGNRGGGYTSKEHFARRHEGGGRKNFDKKGSGFKKRRK